MNLWRLELLAVAAIRRQTLLNEAVVKIIFQSARHSFCPGESADIIKTMFRKLNRNPTGFGAAVSSMPVEGGFSQLLAFLFSRQEWN